MKTEHTAQMKSESHSITLAITHINSPYTTCLLLFQLPNELCRVCIHAPCILLDVILVQNSSFTQSTH